MQIMKCVGLLSMAAVCGLYVADTSPAKAAPTRLLNVYEETISASCASAAVCRVDFSAVTAPLKVTKVSCNFYFTSNGYNDVFVTGIDLGNTTRNEVTHKVNEYLGGLTPLLITATTNQYQPSSDTLHVVPANWRPSVEIALSKVTSINVACSIAGSET